MRCHETNKQTRRPYEKPKLRTIELLAQEVLSVGCKTYDGLVTKGYQLGLPCVGTGCDTIGS